MILYEINRRRVYGKGVCSAGCYQWTPGRVGAYFSKKMRSDRIKIGEIGVDIKNHLKYSRMVIALEPKKGIKDIGMVGIENTFVVTHQGGRCINGHDPGLMHIE
jgi:hypothetical protein